MTYEQRLRDFKKSVKGKPADERAEAFGSEEFRQLVVAAHEESRAAISVGIFCTGHHVCTGHHICTAHCRAHPK
jgi:hypothetical protein